MTANPSEGSSTTPPPAAATPPTSDELRTFLAGQRTVLAWIRTALALMGFGFLVARFGLFLRHLAAIDQDVHVRSTGFSLWMGTSLVVVGVIVNVYAAVRHRHFVRHFRSELSQPHHSLFEILLALLLALLGLTMAGYLVIVEH